MSGPELADQPVVFFPRDRGPGYWDEVNKVFGSVGVPLAVAEAEHTTTMLGLVALGFGVTVVPQSARALASKMSVTYRFTRSATWHWR